jgi:hypothetical protein
MSPENRKVNRKHFSEEISFESMVTGQSRRSLLCRNGSSMDVSNGGLGLVVPYETTKGEILKLLLPLKSLGVAVPVFAEVMWVKPFEQSYKAGLRFLV